MSTFKRDVLDRLWEVRALLEEKSPGAVERITEVLTWLPKGNDEESLTPVRQALAEARRLFKTGRDSEAIREIRVAIFRVDQWF